MAASACDGQATSAYCGDDRLPRILVTLLRALSQAAFLMLLVAALPAKAQQCAGFDDITQFNGFCTNVQWMKNRGVTLGCTTTSFCPDNPVIRLQMAAFMNRVGNVLTPRVESVEASGGAVDLSTDNFLCQTGNIATATYNREVHADAAFSFTSTGPGLLQLSVFASLDGGATWQPSPLNDVVVGVGMTGNGREHGGLTLQRKTFPDFNGTPVRLAIRVVRGSNLTTATLTSWTCHFQAVVTTRAE